MEEILRILGKHFVTVTECGFLYGPAGKTLLRNLEDYWFSNCITMSRYNVFLSTEFSNTLNILNQNEMCNMPFGIGTIENLKSNWTQPVLPEYKIASHRIAKVNVIAEKEKSKDLFNKLQKQRKVWWRKLAQTPSRFNLTEAKRIKNYDLVEIKAEFPFGNITVETLAFYTDTRKLFSQVENLNKNFVEAQMIEHTMSLDWGGLVLLCDAYKDDKYGKTYVHAKLAPYKVAFHIEKLDEETELDDLNDFVLYLSNMLRAKGVQTILTTSERIADICLVPYVVVVDNNSLLTGIIRVTNRSATLTEQVHTTDLVKFIIARC